MSRFYHHKGFKRDGRENKCKDCRRDYDNLPGRKLASRIGTIRRLYGLSQEGYEAILRSQRGRCAICRKKSKRPLVIDHCHSTNKVRGILCHGCNTSLGHLGDTYDGVMRAANYLEAFENTLT